MLDTKKQPKQDQPTSNMDGDTRGIPEGSMRQRKFTTGSPRIYFFTSWMSLDAVPALENTKAIIIIIRATRAELVF